MGFTLFLALLFAPSFAVSTTLVTTPSGYFVIESYWQLVSLGSWDTNFSDQMNNTGSGGAIPFNNPNPPLLNDFYTSTEAISAERPNTLHLDAAPSSSVDMGPDLITITSVSDSTMNTIMENIGCDEQPISPVSSIPEPSVVLLLASGLFGLGIIRKIRL
ncbi:MAG: PEP-CTERM sorting domain-containing protein [Desulfatitalea sp.]|nr:PEP-CTERM sorting domain-containing protein [Desulfatitalea sp.]